MQNETAEKANNAAKEAKRKKRARIINIVMFPFLTILLCGWETVCLKNIPLLVAFLVFWCGFHLIQFGIEKLCKKCWRIVCGLVAMVCTMTYMILFISVMNLLPVTAISEKTTYLTGPRTPDGKMLDIPGAITQRFLPDCLPEDNGFRKVVRTFGFPQVMAGVPEEHRENVARRLFAALKLDDSATWDAPSQVKFESVSDFFEEHLPEEANEEATNETDEDTADAPPVDAEKERRHRVWEAVRNLYQLPWPEEHRDLGEQWLAENNVALDRFGDAVRHSEYFVPFFQDTRRYAFLELLVESYDEFHREMVRGLHLRILHSLDLGDFDRAKHDLLTIARLGEKRMRHPRTVRNLFLASAIRGIAIAATRDMLEYGHANHEQLNTLQAELAPYQSVFSQTDIVFLMRMEGMHMLYHLGSGDIISGLSTRDQPWYGTYATKIVSGSVHYVAWTPVFRKFNEKMNALEAIAEMPLSPEQLTLFDTDNLFKKDKWLSIDGSFGSFLKYILAKGIVVAIPDFIGSIMTDMGKDSTVMKLATVYRQASMTGLLETAFALAHYAIDHDGCYPETLDALVTAGWLAALPVDPCTDGESFRYRLRELDGRPGYILYGVGVNMRDDNGVEYKKIDPETGEEHRGDDVVIAMPADEPE
ncbi:MAG: hypothetical protein FWH27_07215 [Planctomycetaceae bacterium]|nr:hypothetical protein [Planctomycetaceae bacterium]